MVKILALNGSSRINGYSAKAIERILAGAKGQGAEAAYYDLAAMDLRFCTGCLHCQKYGGCTVQDDMQQIYEEIKFCDYLIMGMPIYFRQISGQAKTFIDRLYPFYGENKLACGKKKLILLFTQGADNPELYSQYQNYVKSTMSFFPFELQETLVCYGATHGLADDNKAFYEHAFEIGQSMV